MRKRRVRDRQPTVWVPEGVRLVASEGVRVLSMSSETEPARSPESGVPPAEPQPEGRARAKSPRAKSPRRNAGWRPQPKGSQPEADEEMSVPPEVEAQAQAVMKQYDMKVTGMTLITTKPDKGGAIWRIETNRGPRSLKQLHRTAARSLFSVGAQEYLVKQGARVPALIPTRAKELCIPVEGKLWIVTDWIEELTPATKDLAGAQALCYGLGEFHRHSQGYLPPAGAQNSSRLYRWPKTYQKMLNKMDWFREIARAYSEMPAASALSAMVDTFEQQAREAIARLEHSPYAALVARGEPAWGIVHQSER